MTSPFQPSRSGLHSGGTFVRRKEVRVLRRLATEGLFVPSVSQEEMF